MQERMSNNDNYLEDEKNRALKSSINDTEEALRLLAVLRGLLTTRGQEKLVDEIDKLMNRSLYEVDRVYSEDYMFEPRDEEQGTTDMFDPYTKREELDFSDDGNRIPHGITHSYENYLLNDDEALDD